MPTSPNRFKSISDLDAKLIWSCATVKRMKHKQIAHLVGRTEHSIQNFLWRVRHNQHPKFKQQELSEFARLIPQSAPVIAESAPPVPQSAPPVPQSAPSESTSVDKMSVLDALAELERKAEDARLEYVRLSRIVRGFKDEFKIQ